MANGKTIKVPPMLLKELFERLWRRSKELKHEEKAVVAADPYMQEGRENQNAELADDTIEDIEKTIQTVRLDLIQSARLEIRKALAKMKIGTYGMCEVCKRPIDIARLKAFPQATMCLKCSKEAEGERKK